jgi:hypothetical protein
MEYRAQCYKTFSFRNLLVFIISKRLHHGKLFRLG